MAEDQAKAAALVAQKELEERKDSIQASSPQKVLLTQSPLTTQHEADTLTEKLLVTDSNLSASNGLIEKRDVPQEAKTNQAQYDEHMKKGNLNNQPELLN